MICPYHRDRKNERQSESSEIVLHFAERGNSHRQIWRFEWFKGMVLALLLSYLSEMGGGVHGTLSLPMVFTTCRGSFKTDIPKTQGKQNYLLTLILIYFSLLLLQTKFKFTIYYLCTYLFLCCAQVLFYVWIYVRKTCMTFLLYNFWYQYLFSWCILSSEEYQYMNSIV